MNPKEEYERRLALWRQEEGRHDQRHRRLGATRVALALVLVVLVCLGGRTFLSVIIAFTGIVVGLFLSGKLHDRVLRLREKAQRGRRFYQAGLNRLACQWTGQGSPGTEFLDPHHPYAVDLDLFGPGSLFELLNTAQTKSGGAQLADWLLRHPGAAEIESRQKAVAELRDKFTLREDLGLLTADARELLDTQALMAWAAARAPVTTTMRLAAFVLPLATWSLFAARLLPLAVVAFAAQMLFARYYSRTVNKILGSLTVSAGELNRLADVLQRLEKEPFQTARLQDLQAAWSRDGMNASQCLRGAARLLDWLDFRENFLTALIGPLLLLSPQIAFAIEARRARFGGKVDGWVRALAEMEALSSLAGYAFEHPADPFPELLPETSPARIEAQGLGHPFLPETRCVRNDIALEAEHLYVISGSNMSGKSTWLRALGVNAVLAMAGAPVRARSMRLTPLPLGASIRTVDSLHEGISRFYAEIKRLRQILDLTSENGRLLFLIDEILSGTNSHDRRIGAAAVVKALVERGGMGMITSHDLALTKIVDEVTPPGANYHFEDQFAEGKMSFDYRLRPGVVEKSNALDLMRSIGLKV